MCKGKNSKNDKWIENHPKLWQMTVSITYKASCTLGRSVAYRQLAFISSACKRTCILFYMCPCTHGSLQAEKKKSTARSEEECLSSKKMQECT